ncbi:PaREP1 family protein [Sulfolobus islandicus Y.N.15.51]|jgi:hypothetical protein|uniref:PaREP1 family protein n=1 Tax=Saccharolobus islandicus (strain Y.N.15.51 / Yellowstone \|nr:PaREP1 family protein [Sulfolobus islandicus]ACP49092.1 PaREP1 family protein [Sulfolobus islandicus Y.N.15.51]
MNSQILKSSADVYLEEAEEFLRRGDTVQASEKYYKAAEEAIKILALSLNLEILDSVKKEGWSLKFLNRAVYQISKFLGEDIIEYWNSATAIYTVNLDLETLKLLANDVAKLVEIANEKYNKLLRGG